MEKDQEQKNYHKNISSEEAQRNNDTKNENLSKKVPEDENRDKETELNSEKKINELEDKLARAFAEMENQRRRFEKEKDDAFDYGGFIFW